MGRTTRVMGHRPALLVRVATLALAMATISPAAVVAAGLTGADATGDVSIKLVSCCKASYFGPAVDAWNASHPHVKVSQEVVPFAQLNDILEARLRSRDSSFDIFVMDPPRTTAFAVKKYALDITPYFAKDAEAAINPTSLQATSLRGHIYAAPVFNSTQVLLYNRALLAKAGVAPPSIDPAQRTTWERVVSDAQQVKDKTGVPSGIVFSQGQGYYQLQPIIMSAGGGSGLTGDDNMVPEVNTPGWKTAMTWFGSLFSSGVTPRGVPFTQMDAIFTAGNAPFIATTSDRVREFTNQKLDFGVAAFPRFAAGKAYTPCDSFALAINPNSKQQAQALEFIKWVALTQEGGDAAAAQSPNVPANLLVRDRISQEMERAGTGLEGLTKLIAYETSTTCVHRPASVGFIQFETEFNRADADIVGGANASDVLDKMQANLERDFERLR